MTARDEIHYAAENFEVSSNLFFDAVIELFPLLISLLVASKTSQTSRAADVADAAQQIASFDLKKLERMHDEVLELAGDFKKTSNELARVILLLNSKLPRE